MGINEKLEELRKNDATKGETYYGKKFTSNANFLRDSIILLRKGRKAEFKGGERKKLPNGKFKIVKGKQVKPAELSNKQTVEKLREVLLLVLKDLE